MDGDPEMLKSDPMTSGSYLNFHMTNQMASSRHRYAKQIIGNLDTIIKSQ